MSDGPDPLQRTVLIGVGALAVALAVALVFVQAISSRPLPPRVVTYLGIKILVSTFNVVLLLVLIVLYAGLYRDMPNQFTLSLVLFTVALFLYAFTSNPLVHFLLNFRGAPGLGPFTFIPDLFASVAIVVLLYQSYK